MFCHKCGTQNKDNARFCVKCGYPIMVETADDEKSHFEEQERKQLEVQEKVKKEKEQKLFNQGLIGCLGIISAIVIIVLIFSWFGDADEAEIVDESITLDQDLIVITDDEVYIRTEPNGTVIGQAQPGDVFEIGGTDGDWFMIHMFSGEYRYVHSSLALHTDSLPRQQDEATRRSAFQALVNAEDRASAEADRRIPPATVEDINRNIDLQRLLDDRYKLEVCHRFGVQPAYYNTIKLEGIRKGWMP